MTRPWQQTFFLLLHAGMLSLVPGVAFAAEGQGTEAWEAIFINWFPMIVLIGVWIYFMKQMRGKGSPWNMEQTNQHLEKIEQSLERIARALEKK